MTAMLPAIDAILHLFSRRAKDREVLNQTIESLDASDAELERRMRMLRDQVDIYQRTMQQDDPADG